MLSGLTFPASRQQQQMVSCLGAHIKARSRQPINGFKYLINNRGTIARDAAKKMCLVYAKCKIKSGRDWRRVFCTMPTNPGRTRQGEYNRETGETRVKTRGASINA
jgi:hypothetical protein